MGETIGTYRCRAVLKLEEAGDPTRSWGLNETHICDGHFFPLHNPLLYLNSIAGEETCGGQNVEMVSTQGESGQHVVTYTATKAVQRGEELLTDYGSKVCMHASTYMCIYIGEAIGRIHSRHVCTPRCYEYRARMPHWDA